MPYVVIVMHGQPNPEYERAVGPFSDEEDAAKWCSDEGIILSAGEGSMSDAQWGVIVRFETRGV